MISCIIDYIYILYLYLYYNLELTAEFSGPIELIELSLFCHDHTKKHDIQVIK